MNIEEECDPIEATDICRDCERLYKGYKKVAGKNVLVKSVNIINLSLGDMCNICSVMHYYYEKMYCGLRERKPFCNWYKNWIGNNMMQRDF